MSRETFIENNVIRNRSLSVGVSEALVIRRCRIGRGFGVADLVFLPDRGPRRLIIVEAKQGGAADAKVNVVGQLLMYYAGALRLGARGVRLLRSFAAENRRSACSHRPKSLKMLCGGLSPPDAAWKELCTGRRLRPEQVGLYVALDSEPGVALKGALNELATQQMLSVGVISVLGRDRLSVWRPGL